MAAVVPGLSVVRGNLMSQEPQPNALYGEEVAQALYDGPIPAVVDLSEAAHRNRAVRLGELSALSAYYLIASYD